MILEQIKSQEKTLKSSFKDKKDTLNNIKDIRMNFLEMILFYGDISDLLLIYLKKWMKNLMKMLLKKKKHI